MKTRWAITLPPKEKKRLEFSKIILLMVMLTYFAGVVIGAVVVLGTAPDMLGEYLAFVGAPTGIAIGFYTWKARTENKIKLASRMKGKDRDAMMAILREGISFAIKDTTLHVSSTTTVVITVKVLYNYSFSMK